MIEHDDGIVLIERRNPPHGFALPGGFVDYGETVEIAAVREAREETSLSVELVALLGVYSDPARDSRQHTVSTVFVAKAEGTLKGADDAKTAFIARLDQLPSPLCFGHAQILEDYKRWRQSGWNYMTPPALTEEDRRMIADIAWQTLAAAAALPISGVRSALRSGPLSQPGACHVVVKTRHGEVRGSAGSMEPRTTLALAVEEMTAAAVTAASRPITRADLAELRVEVSVLGVTTEIVVATND